MTKAVHWLFYRQVLIFGAIASLLSMGCSNHLSNNQSTTNQNSSPVFQQDTQILTRTRERQGTQYIHTQSSIGKKNRLLKLRFAVLATQNPEEEQKMIQPLDNHLEKSLGREIDFLIIRSYSEIIELLIKGKIDLAYLGPLAYIEALDKGAKIQPLVTSIDKNTEQPWYRSCIIVRKNSSIKTLTDLKRKRVAFVDKASTSGYLMPFIALKKLGIDPERDFSKLIYAGSHSQSVAALKNNTVDAATTNISYYLKKQRIGQLPQQDYKLIWESPPIPNFPVVASKKLSSGLIKQLKKAFISIPEGTEDILGAESAGYTIVRAEDYIVIRQLYQELKLMSPAKK